jgi:hypothetical protein
LVNDEFVPTPETQPFFPQNAVARPAAFPQTSPDNAPCHECPPETEDDFCNNQTLKVVDIDDDEENFDYGEFMRTRGREAFVLAEIILPANSRQGQ